MIFWSIVFSALSVWAFAAGNTTIQMGCITTAAIFSVGDQLKYAIREGKR